MKTMEYSLQFYPTQYSAKNTDWPYGISSGGPIYKFLDGKTEILLVVRDRPDGSINYGLTKGTLKVGETLEQAAIREILEESGANVCLKTYLGAHTQTFLHHTKQYEKTLHYFAAEFIAFTHEMDREHDRVEWHTIDEAIRLCEQSDPIKNEAEILSRLKLYLGYERD